jgi:hypothetical protein
VFSQCSASTLPLLHTSLPEIDYCGINWHPNLTQHYTFGVNAQMMHIPSSAPPLSLFRAGLETVFLFVPTAACPDINSPN